ncbi:MAG: transporter substrate-binding domain-containing protein [Candidatus Pacebacteria bacterium]|nr:transporter substrate-binding domain-containing protein [Candidatus Paceibacterota bacterium]
MKKIIKILLLSLVFISTLQTAQAEKIITVGTIERAPFMMKSENGKLSGFSIDIWDEISQRLGIKSEFKEVTVFGEMIDAVSQNNVDLAIANISITSAREKIMDYSQPIYDSGLQIMIPKNTGNISYLQIIWDSGIIKFILFALLLLLVIAHVLWFFERGVENTRHDYFRDDYFGGVWDAFWWAFIIMTMGGFENEVPHKILSRILAMVWITASLFFVSILTAKITTAFTVSELQTQISSYEDLHGKKVGISAGPTARDFLENNNISVYREYDLLGELIKDLENGTLDAVVQDAPILQYYAGHEGQGKVQVVGEIFKPEKYGILFPEGSDLKESVDQTLIEMKEDGTYQDIFEKYFIN